MELHAVFSMFFQCILLDPGKVIDTKYSKHLPYTGAHTIECVCSKINDDLIHNFHFTFQAYTLPHTLDGICDSLFKFHT